jgi:ATP-dependent RNA helicase DDX54/DBP10
MPKRTLSDISESDAESLSSVVSNDEIDISSALTGKKKLKLAHHDSDEEDEDLHEIIRQATSKRDMKGGTELLKKTKGKSKLAKGEIGGGSFQSMGMLCILKTFEKSI